MIFGNLNHREEFSFLNDEVKACFAYAKEHDLISYEKGTYKINGDDFFVNVVEYTTTAAENRFWEAHKAYIDVHVVLEGNEQIDLNFTDKMELKEYVQEDDFLPMEGEKCASVILKPGDFLICYPNDAHRTAVAVAEPEAVKKVIFKVKI